MILSRAAEQLTDPADLAGLQESEALEGLAFDLLEDARRSRILTAVLTATKRLREEIVASEPLDEPVLPRAEAKLDESHFQLGCSLTPHTLPDRSVVGYLEGSDSGQSAMCCGRTPC